MALILCPVCGLLLPMLPGGKLQRVSIALVLHEGVLSNMNAPPTEPTSSGQKVVLAIVVLLVGYAVATVAGYTSPAAPSPEAHAAEHAAGGGIAHYWAVIPFCLLLAAIAIFPLVEMTSHWWEHNPNKLMVAAALGVLTLVYLAVLHPRGSMDMATLTLRETIFTEYIPFIILLFTLYTICGGIRITGDLPAHALTNSAFILAGGVLASFIGTTGAAMLLVRPLLETNRERKHVRHTIVFFIFVVCNCGGLLLPLGDPPLFLGYLSGVDFLWTLSLWRSWLLVNGLLLAIYFLWDHFVCYPRENKADLVIDENRVRPIQFLGMWPNALLLLGVVLSVALLDPSKPVPGTSWYPWIYLREAVQLGLVAASLALGSRAIREANSFNYVAILEVAALFIGIFVCMQPALEILRVDGAGLGINTPRKAFWASGGLSSVLDNAPTYLVFFKAAQSLPSGDHMMAGVAVAFLSAISIGSVFGGAMTYIGNGPNFMVKAIAESSGVKMPSFFGYMMYSFAILLPILALNAWLFF